jgi:hypothetical protein
MTIWRQPPGRHRSEIMAIIFWLPLRQLAIPLLLVCVVVEYAVLPVNTRGRIMSQANESAAY